MQKPEQQKPADHHHTHAHPHTPTSTEESSRMWLYGGLVILLVALIYTGVLFMRSRGQSATSSAAGADVTQMQFDPANDSIGVSTGPVAARVVVREFADFQCPACGGFEPVLEQMRKDYVDSGKVRFVFFDYPLDQHKNAMMAAQVARCAGVQDHYWQMHDALYAHQADWSELPDPMSQFQNYAAGIGMDSASLMVCIRSGETRQAVVRSTGYGDAYGVHATPTFGINGDVYTGAMPYAQLKQLIDQALAGGKS